MRMGIVFLYGVIFLKVLPHCHFSAFSFFIQAFGEMIHLKAYGNKFVELLGNDCNLNPQVIVWYIEILSSDALASSWASELLAR